MTQFVHRTTAYVLLLIAAIYWLKARASRHKATAFWALCLLAGIVAQAVYGIFTLLHVAPLEVAIFHQLGALALLGLAMRAKFEAAYPAEQKIRG